MVCSSAKLSFIHKWSSLYIFWKRYFVKIFGKLFGISAFLCFFTICSLNLCENFFFTNDFLEFFQNVENKYFDGLMKPKNGFTFNKFLDVELLVTN